MSAQGKCLGKGTFEEMSTSGIDFSSLLQTNEEEEEKKKPPAVVYERATSVEHAHSSLQNIGSTFSLTSIGTEFEVRSESSIFSESSFGEQCSNLSLNLFMIVSLNKKYLGLFCVLYICLQIWCCIYDIRNSLHELRLLRSVVLHICITFSVVTFFVASLVIFINILIFP